MLRAFQRSKNIVSLANGIDPNLPITTASRGDETSSFYQPEQSLMEVRIEHIPKLYLLARGIVAHQSDASERSAMPCLGR